MSGAPRRPLRGPTARTVAAEVLARVARDGAFAAAALDAELERHVQLDGRDRALATELVYGTLRLRPWLAERLAAFAPRGLSSLDPKVAAILLVAAYQVLVLTRVPAFAAVSEAVEDAKRARGERLARFVNAVLRKLSASERPGEDELAAALFASVEPELARAIERAVGAERARRLIGRPSDPPPPLGLRVEVADGRDAWVERLREARPSADISAGRVSPLAVLLRGAGRVAELPGYTAGAWTAQEEGSQAIALALGARPGEVVLDACAGRGNKTGILARAVGREGAVDAADLHASKLERLETELERVGLHVRATHAVDWSAGTGDVRGPYDRVLVDAPCTGTGTLRRRPDLLGKRVAADVPRLAALQEAALRRAASLVKPGGRVVYAVCSVLREEAEDVLERAVIFGLVPCAFDAPTELAVARGVSAFRLLPDEHGTDGYFVACLQRSDTRVAAGGSLL